MLCNHGPRKLTDGTLEWEEEDGLVYYKGKLYVPADKDVQTKLVKIHHDSLTAGHPGRNETLEAVTCLYWWPGMSSFIAKYVAGCETCQQMKPAAHPTAPLQLHDVPEGPWQMIRVDLITGLPKSKGFDVIAVYVDHYTKQCHAIPVKGTIDAAGIADLHVCKIFRLHGIPRRIISDRGPQFAARITRALYKRLGI